MHDTHFHLDLYDNIPQVIKEIEECKIYTVAVTNLPQLYLKLADKIQSKYIRVALGFHPELITQYKRFIPMMWDNILKTQYIGEIGLDLKNKELEDCNNQINFFEDLILRCNKLGGKILSVHSRGSENKVLSIIGKNFNGNIILHWYSGSMNHLDLAIENGYYFSINFAMLQSIKGKKIIEKIPINRLLLESDGPFVKINKKIYRPYDLINIIQNLAKCKKIEEMDLKQKLFENFKQLLHQ